jgi:hypothetical protein
MGGGVGISIGATFRVVTENVLFAMPEVRKNEKERGSRRGERKEDVSTTDIGSHYHSLLYL